MPRKKSLSVDVPPTEIEAPTPKRRGRTAKVAAVEPVPALEPVAEEKPKRGRKPKVSEEAPGVAETPMTEGILHRQDTASAAAFVAQYTLKRVADASEVAEGIAFLISDEASFITGSTLPVDGGRAFH